MVDSIPSIELDLKAFPGASISTRLDVVTHSNPNPMLVAVATK